MSEEMRTFALYKADEAKDIVAQELFRRATSVDVEVIKNEYKNVIFSFEFSGATVSAKWNCADRFNDPDVVYSIFLQMLYHSEDHPVAAKPIPEPVHDEPLGFLFAGSEDLDDDGEDV